MYIFVYKSLRLFLKGIYSNCEHYDSTAMRCIKYETLDWEIKH